MKELNYKYNHKYTYGEFPKVECPIHGDFEVTYEEHLAGKECPECMRINELKLQRVPYILEAKRVHDGAYKYYDLDTPQGDILVTCPDHGTFYVDAQEHLEGKGCPACGLGLKHGDEVLVRKNSKSVWIPKYFAYLRGKNIYATDFSKWQQIKLIDYED